LSIYEAVRSSKKKLQKLALVITLLINSNHCSELVYILKIRGRVTGVVFNDTHQ